MRRCAVQVRGELLVVAVEGREKEKYTPDGELGAVLHEETRFVSVAFTLSQPEM